MKTSTGKVRSPEFSRAIRGATTAAAAIIFFFLAGCASTPSSPPEPAFTLSGQTRYQDSPLTPNGGEVFAYPDSPVAEPIRSPIRSDGTFRFSVPGGTYYLMGRSEDRAGGPLFAYWGRNPVHVSGHVERGLVLLFTPEAGPPRPIEGGGISGTVLLDNIPLKGAFVAAYLDAGTGFHGPPYALSAPSDEDGRYHLPLGPGTYFVVARHRSSKGVFEGPLLKGDQVGYFSCNPVTLRYGKGLRIDLSMAQVNRPRGGGSLSLGESIVVTGRVFSEAGQPVEGVRVVLYESGWMLGRPSFVSSATDSGGRYRLEVSRRGKFFVAARSVIGKPPETGELVGFYRGSEDHSIDLSSAERLRSVDITVRKVW